MKRFSLPLQVTTQYSDNWFTAGEVYDVISLFDGSGGVYGFHIIADNGFKAYCVLYDTEITGKKGNCGWTGEVGWDVVVKKEQLEFDFS